MGGTIIELQAVGIHPVPDPCSVVPLGYTRHQLRVCPVVGLAVFVDRLSHITEHPFSRAGDESMPQQRLHVHEQAVRALKDIVLCPFALPECPVIGKVSEEQFLHRRENNRYESGKEGLPLCIQLAGEEFLGDAVVIYVQELVPLQDISHTILVKEALQPLPPI